MTLAAEQVCCASAQIHSLLSRLAHLADEGELSEYLDLFTPDAVWEMRDTAPTGASAERRVGRDDIATGVVERRAGGMQGPGTATRHVVTTVDVQVQSSDEARSVAYWMFYRDTDAVPQLIAIGRYDDVIRRTADGWRLAHRVIRVR
jgi:3-phenylpropionate/cinnamic acid dioxygenase small subunit